MDHPAEQNMVSVYRASDPILAGLAAECLENNEIPVARKEDARTLDGGFEVSVGTIELLVAAERVNEAAAVLDKWECLRKTAAAAPPKPPTPSGSFENVKYEVMYSVFCSILILMSLASTGRVPYIAFVIFLPSLQSLIRILWAYSYWRHMRSLGYEWPTLGDAYEIKTSLGYRKAYALPPAGDVALLPGYKPDADGIYHFLIGLADYKREAALKRRKKKP